MSIMKNLSDYFTLDTTIHPGKGVMFYTFDNAKRMEFIQDCLLPFREAYIESKKITGYSQYIWRIGSRSGGRKITRQRKSDVWRFW